MHCTSIPEMGILEYGNYLRIGNAKKRLPLHGEMELTFRCNNRCVHCFVNKRANDRKEVFNEMSCGEICHILDEMVDEGCLWLVLTGGEPLLREDFSDIYTYAKKKGLLITLFTNGTLVTPHIADFLSEWPPYFIEISIYGMTRETYEKVTRVPGSYESCLQGIEYLVERKLPLKLKTMVLTINRHELEDMKAFAKRLGLAFRYDPILSARVDGDTSPLRFRISPQEVVQLDLGDEKRHSGLKELSRNFLGPYENTEYLYGCGAGINSFHIDPHGYLGICTMSRKPRYNLRNGSFKEGWSDFLPEIRAQKPKGDYKCAHCELLAFCGQCPGWSQMEYGDQEIPVQYLCEIGHLRAYALGIKNTLNGEG
jgi:radical SAM protein with 4Fe4S-binding SPASM domain